MKQLAAIVFITLTVTVWTLPTASAGQPVSSGQPVPSYLILRAPARTSKGHSYYPGRGYEVRTQAYAYGWFGARPRRHYRRSSGYYENYIQRSKK